MLCILLAALMAAVPPTRSWECVPSVVKSDGSESFRLLVSADAGAQSVTLQPSIFLQPAGECVLRDDGQEGDQVAGDGVYTSPVFAPSLPAAYLPLLDRFRRDPDSPAGIGYLDVGTVTITRADGTLSKFQPDLGLILPDRASVPWAHHSPELQATSHLLNIRHATAAQHRLRGVDSDLQNLTRKTYAYIDDASDFLVFFCPKKVEVVPETRPENARAGLFEPVRVDFDGTGRPRMDESAAYGSAGRLRGLIFLDVGQRGIYSANLVHELMHLWSPLRYAPILESDQAHYSGHSNVGSIVGGSLWGRGGEESLFVASRGSGQVLKFDALTGDYSSTVADLSAVVPSPGAMFAPPGEYLYVAASSGSSIAQVDAASGQVVRTFGSGTELINPRGMALGPNGTLLVASYGTHQILKYNLATGAYEGVFAAGSALAGPMGLVRSTSGSLVVTSESNNRILEYDGVSGAFIRVVAEGSPLDGPFGLAFGPNGNLFVANFNTHQILEYAWPAGTFVRVFAEGCSLVKPTWIAFRSDGHLLVSNSGADYVVEFDQNGACANATFAGSPLSQPRGLVIRGQAVDNVVNCEEGRNGGHRAAPIDLYAMGLIPASAVPDVLLSDPNGPWPLQSCGQAVTVASTIPFSQVIEALGPRLATEARDFRLTFIVETDDRLLNETEMAFYHHLAEHVERLVDINQPDPYVGFNWVPLTRYFQAGTTWTSRLQIQCDFDGDGDVDQGDYALFEPCLSGPMVPLANGCEKFDLDRDGDVDQSDYGQMQVRFSGPQQ
ncbi:MAG TPA: NHL repeat-containing protein [Phycisphaerae bacterium]|nr:hypothetical protein [Phycisphaerae bacterium]HOB75109.1 NHL repeat-containing protein [Phycisphaerae bacterium]HOJ53174.1 NHL repeat-containing protein [Phycisphaerae bacterium]HOL25138.1 NHL repeat-containing protein [Phycisphaerae bacterium]HPP19686.1 NHL repeat-containing protein [Phycisphaerae bacterium]